MKSPIVVTRERLYGGPCIRGSKFTYRAKLNGTEIATGATNQAALEAAWLALEEAHRAQSNQVLVAVTTDGTVMTAREYVAGSVELVYHHRNLLDSANGNYLYRPGGSVMGQLKINNNTVTLKAFLDHYAKAYDA